MNLPARLLPVLLPLLLCAASGAGQSKSTASAIASAAHYQAPRGWEESFSVNQGDPQALLARGLHRIRVRLLGGAGSRYKSSGSFLAGFETRSKDGARPEKLGSAVVSGARVLLFRRLVPLKLPAPETTAPVSYVEEEFCVVPQGSRFFILTYSYSGAVPDPDYDGHKAWQEFLDTFRVSHDPRI